MQSRTVFSQNSENQGRRHSGGLLYLLPVTSLLAGSVTLCLLVSSSDGSPVSSAALSTDIQKWEHHPLRIVPSDERENLSVS